MTENVLILGASPNKERYSHKALQMLLDHGHSITLVNPNYDQIENHPVVKDLNDAEPKGLTLTLYLKPSLSTALIDKIIEYGPKRVILNPGSENPELEVALKNAGIPFEKACTLVLLSTDQF